ncbi:MAG: hypothetical protein IKN17_08465 [Ruminococcus sp.]|nr:hypothetical protein [Ruminococcus sp.]
MKDNKENLIPDEDYEYEKSLAEEVRARQQALEEARRRAEEEQTAYEKEQQKKRDKRLAQERIELMKLKSGVIDESETFKEEHEAPRELHGKEKIANFWYHNKIWILFAAFIIVVVTFIVVDELTRVRADMNVLMIANNGLAYRQDEMEAFFAKYCDDLNGDGQVKVTVMMMPLDPDSKDYQTQQGYQAKFMSQIQLPDDILVVCDSNTEPDFLGMFKSDLSKDFPGNKYIDQYGLSLNFKFLAEELKYENMPYDVHLSMRTPIETLGDSVETMQEYYDQAFVVFERIVNDLTKRAEETNDPGLTTEPAAKPTKSMLNVDD